MKKLILTSLSLFCFIFFSCVKPSVPPPAEDPMPESVASNENLKVLIYGGPGSWKAEVGALKKVLVDHAIGYDVVLPEKINQFSLEDFVKYRAIVFAGGDAPTVRSALSIKTRKNIRRAVQERGLNYLGFCAGAWIAVAPEPAAGEDVVYGLGVVSGPLQEFNFLSKAGLKHAVDEAQFPDGSKRRLLWWGGPATPQLPGSVVAKYSDGSPAISQIRSGKGMVVISGLHPALTKGILQNLSIYDSDISAPEYAWSLFEAVLFEKPLATFP